jgi:hypothetical protein
VNVDEYLADRGVMLPVLERDDWAFWNANSEAGRAICQLWLTAQPLLALCHDTRPALVFLLVRQSDVIAYG